MHGGTVDLLRIFHSSVLACDVSVIHQTLQDWVTIKFILYWIHSTQAMPKIAFIGCDRSNDELCMDDALAKPVGDLRQQDSESVINVSYDCLSRAPPRPVPPPRCPAGLTPRRPPAPPPPSVSLLMVQPLYSRCNSSQYLLRRWRGARRRRPPSRPARHTPPRAFLCASIQDLLARRRQWPQRLPASTAAAAATATCRQPCQVPHDKSCALRFSTVKHPPRAAARRLASGAGAGRCAGRR